MMRRVYRPSQRKRKSTVFRHTTSTAALVVVGAAVFYAGMTWFRSHTTVSDQLIASGQIVSSTIAPEAVRAAEAIPSRANLVSAFDGQVTGAVNRAPGEQSAGYHIIAYLPGLDQATETYSVWLLKDGLADVKRMGDLGPRADGSWVLDFTAGPLSGIALPDAYRTMVIMKAAKGTESTPNGTKMAEAIF